MSVPIGDVFMPWPGLNRIIAPLTAVSISTVDADNEKIAVIFQCPEDGELEYVALGIGAVGTYPAADVDIRLETVNLTTGNPTGTLFGANTNYAWTFSTGSYAMYKIGPMTANASVSQGDYIAVVYVPPASPDNGNVGFTGMGDETYGFPYSKFYNGSAWVTTPSRIKAVLYYTTGVAVHPANLGASVIWNQAVNSGDTYNHLGVSLTSRVALEVPGMWSFVDLDADATCKLISGTDTVEKSCSLDSNYRVGNYQQLHYGYFTTPLDVVADTAYKYVIAPDSVTDVIFFGPRCLVAGDSAITILNSHEANPFSAVEGQEGELSTPFWRALVGGGTGAWPLVGPIVRSIG